MSTPLHTQQHLIRPHGPWKILSPATTARILSGLERLRRRQPHERLGLAERTFTLLTRGLGVSQIIEKAVQPYDSPVEQLRVATLLRPWLVYYLNSGHAPDGVKNTLADLTRTLTYLDRTIDRLVKEVAPERSGYIYRQRVTPMATDEFGVQVDVRDGLPSFTLVGYPDGLQALLCGLLRNRLGAAWPQRRITVDVPDGWAPHEDAVSSLARSIDTANRR